MSLSFHEQQTQSYLLHVPYKWCCLLVTFANSLDPDQDRQNVGPDLDTLIVFLKEFFFFLEN